MGEQSVLRTGLALAQSPVPDPIVEPFLHVDREGIRNPMTGRHLPAGSALEGLLRRLFAGAAANELEVEHRKRLLAEGWLGADEPGLERPPPLAYGSLQRALANVERLRRLSESGPITCQNRPDISLVNNR